MLVLGATLAATLEGVAVHPMSQILERPDLKRKLAVEPEETGPIQHLFRLDYAKEERNETHTPRWPVTTVLR